MKTSFRNERMKRLNDFERRLAPSMVFPEPVKCALCDFTNDVRINLIRHLRTHRNDDHLEKEDDDDDEEEMEVESCKEVDVGGSSVAERWQRRSWEAEGYRRPTTNDIVMSRSDAVDMSIKSTSTTKPHFTQRTLADCLVSSTSHSLIHSFIHLFTKCNKNKTQ